MIKNHVKQIFEPTSRWVRAMKNGITVADSKRAKLMIESFGEQDYYFPIDDVQQALLEPSDYTETSGFRGTKRFWNLAIGDDIIENAAWTYDVKEGRPDFSGYLAFDWNKMDHWFEEAEEVFYHPRNPYHRVDYVESTRHVEVLIDGVKVAETDRPLMVFETLLTTRIYIPEADVDQAYLTPTDASSHCPYKGDASYYSVEVNGEQYDNIVWTYPDPVPEAPRLKGKLAFWPDKDKRIQLVVDGDPYSG